jgi:hypothetical protein
MMKCAIVVYRLNVVMAELTIPPCSSIFMPMSATDIINELPKLTEAERRAVREKLTELAAQNEDIQACNQAALEGALMLDRMENEDAGRKPR